MRFLFAALSVVSCSTTYSNTLDMPLYSRVPGRFGTPHFQYIGQKVNRFVNDEFSVAFRQLIVSGKAVNTYCTLKFSVCQNKIKAKEL
jgi:hypothetical protein